MVIKPAFVTAVLTGTEMKWNEMKWTLQWLVIEGSTKCSENVLVDSYTINTVNLHKQPEVGNVELSNHLNVLLYMYYVCPDIEPGESSLHSEFNCVDETHPHLTLNIQMKWKLC